MTGSRSQSDRVDEKLARLVESVYANVVVKSTSVQQSTIERDRGGMFALAQQVDFNEVRLAVQHLALFLLVLLPTTIAKRFVTRAQNLHGRHQAFLAILLLEDFQITVPALLVFHLDYHGFRRCLGNRDPTGFWFARFARPTSLDASSR